MHISLHTRSDWTIYRALIGQTFLDEPMNVEVSITLSYFSDSTITLIGPNKRAERGRISLNGYHLTVQ